MARIKTFDLYSIGDAARKRGVSNSTMYLHARSGKIPSLRASDGSFLFRPKDIEPEKPAK